MVGFVQLAIGGVLVVVGLFAVARIWESVRVLATLRGNSPTGVSGATDGDVVTVEGRVFVEESPVAAERLFEDGSGRIGAYVWRMAFTEGGSYVYDDDRGSFRQARQAFASGVEAGEFGVAADGRRLHVDTSWLGRSHDTPELSAVEVGDPSGNVSLPSVVSRRVFDAPSVHLDGTHGECSVDRLTDVVDLYRDDVHTDEYHVETRGVPEGAELFVRGELRTDGGRATVVGTDETPLLLSDCGPDEMQRHLLWTAARRLFTVGLLGALGLLFVL